MKTKFMKLLSITLLVLCCQFSTYGLVMIEGVEPLNQYPTLPTGCEATALAMLLQFYGVDITKEQVATDMPKASNPYYYNEVRYGEHPNNAFIGDPFGSGYGVFSPVIIDMINDYLPNCAVDLGGGSFDIIYDCLDKGEPVMIWATIDMKYPTGGPIWETPSDGTYQWLYHEHALVAVGYDEEHIYLNDPYHGSMIAYCKDLVESRWISIGSQAVGIHIPKEEILQNCTCTICLCDSNKKTAAEFLRQELKKAPTIDAVGVPEVLFCNDCAVAMTE